ncbi:hypothetical protein [Arenibaculum sp.]|jgi:hypothetical protein|uniref:hypothetical protein n=1 Tax=Arenibaculum sp. TaxID=2865862 RepID=UPI002E16311A|nr:hypothetical protein [Arenibaculum sp.]
MSSDAEVTVIGRGALPAGAVPADSDPVRRLTRLGTGSCVMILDQVLRGTGDAAGAADAAALARRMTRATRDFRAAAADLSRHS